MKKLVYILFLFLLSCQEDKTDFSFSTSDKSKLKIDVQSFIDSLQSKNPKATDKFRNNEVLWLNAGWNNKTKGKPSIIPSNLSLNELKYLQNLTIDSLYVDNDTIKGLKNTYHYKCEYDSITELIEKYYYKFVLKNGRINNVIKYDYNYNLKIDNNFSTDGKYLNRQITIGCFYMDDTEITSNEYRQFIPRTKKDSLNQLKYDSIQKVKEKAELDSIELHWNDYILKDN